VILTGLSAGSTTKSKLLKKFLVTGDFFAFAGARGAVSVLEKVGCEHAKAVAQPGFSLSANDIKNPLVKAIALSGKFYSELWLKGGREIADEAIREKEKESHDALEQARRVEEAVERARLIGIPFMIQLHKLF
jgi:hypothetical protein